MLSKRVFSGVLLIGGLILSAFYLPAVAVWALMVAVSALGAREYHGLVRAAGMPVFTALGTLAGSALITVTFWTLLLATSAWPSAQSAELEWFTLLCIILAVIVRQFPQKNNPQPFQTMACTLLGILYVPFLFNFFTKLAFGWGDGSWLEPVGQTGRLLIFYLVVVVKAMDTGAYFTGTLLGRHKLIPRISPGKTWEGFYGGIAAGLAASLIFFWVRQSPDAPGVAEFGSVAMTLWDAVILGVLLPVTGVVGDLAESLLKRASGAKDSGMSIPGLGGILDILDSLLFAAPVLYYYARFFLPQP